jgi:hypothetical protein
LLGSIGFDGTLDRFDLGLERLIHAVMALPPDERRDRAKVNEAVAEAERANADSSDDAVHDNPHYVQCRWCGKWINGSDPARLAEHRGPIASSNNAGYRMDRRRRWRFGKRFFQTGTNPALGPLSAKH